MSKKIRPRAEPGRLERHTAHHQPTSVLLSVDMVMALRREAIVRGDVGVSTLIRIIITEYFASRPVRRRPRAPKSAKPETPVAPSAEVSTVETTQPESTDKGESHE